MNDPVVGTGKHSGASIDFELLRLRHAEHNLGSLTGSPAKHTRVGVVLTGFKNSVTRLAAAFSNAELQASTTPTPPR